MKKTMVPQVIWGQEDDKIILILTNQYLQFCWEASGFSGITPIERLEGVKLFPCRTGLEILTNGFFTIPMIFQLKWPIKPEKTEGGYYPSAGICVTMYKEDVDKHWESFQINTEKEFYIQQNKSIDKQAKIEQNQTVFFAKYKLSKDEYAKMINEVQQKMSACYEQTFEFLRNGAKLKHLIKLHNKLMKIDLKNQLNQTVFEVVSCFVKKAPLFHEFHYKFLRPTFLPHLQYKVNVGVFILVKASIDSLPFQAVHDLVINDAFENGVKCAVYNIPNIKSIKKGTWMIIKEPQFEFSFFHLPYVTINDPQDIIFLSDQNVFQKDPLVFPHNVNAETRQNIQEIYKNQVKAIVFNHEMKDDLRITLMSFEWKSSKISLEPNKLFVEQEGDWIGAVIKEEGQIGENCFQITLEKSVKSELFIECLKRQIEKTPGSPFLFWRPCDFKLESIAQFLLYKAGLSFQGLQHFSQNSPKLTNIEEVLDFWKLQKEIIFQEVESLSKGKKKENKKKDKQFRHQNMVRIHQQIFDIVEAYQTQNFKLLQPFFPKEVCYKFDKDNCLEMNKTIDSFNSRKIVDALYNEPNLKITHNALFYLTEYGKMNYFGKPIYKEEFSQYVVQNKISKEGIEFKLADAIQSLSLVELPVSTDVIFKLQKKEEISQIDKIKNQKAEINSMLAEGEIDEELLIYYENQDIQSVLGEFDEGESICDMESRIEEIIEKNEDEEEEVKKDFESFHSKDSTQQYAKQENLIGGFLKQEDKIELSGQKQQKRETKNQKKSFEINVQEVTEKKETTRKYNENNQRKNQQNQISSQPSLSGLNQKYQQKKQQKLIDSGWRWVPKKQLEEAKNQLEETKNQKIAEKVSEPIFKFQKQNIPDELSDKVSSCTLRSKESHQPLNEHWKERLANRFGIEISNQSIKTMVLNQIKQTLNNPNSTLKQSLIQSDRFILCNPLTKMNFILKKTFSARTNKTIYVPITVLTKDMKFK